MRATMMESVTGIAVIVGCLAVAFPTVGVAGDLEPPGPPAPTMRTLESLGFDCPDDVANSRSNLIYTFVTNTAGFDTGVSISNTGADPFGTVPPPCPGNVCQCTLSYFGTNAPLPFNTTAIAPGITYVNITSAVAPNFQGYMIAACNFPYARGFALVNDIGAQRLAAAQLAQVICSDRGPTAMGAGR